MKIHKTADLVSENYNNADRFGICDILESIIFVKRSQGSENY